MTDTARITDPAFEDLRRQVERMDRELSALKLAASRLSPARPAVFPVSVDDTQNNSWSELTAAGDELTAHYHPRRCLNDADPEAFIDLSEDQAILIEQPDGPYMRYVRIRGSNTKPDSGYTGVSPLTVNDFDAITFDQTQFTVTSAIVGEQVHAQIASTAAASTGVDIYRDGVLLKAGVTKIDIITANQDILDVTDTTGGGATNSVEIAFTPSSDDYKVVQSQSNRFVNDWVRGHPDV